MDYGQLLKKDDLDLIENSEKVEQLPMQNIPAMILKLMNY